MFVLATRSVFRLSSMLRVWSSTTVWHCPVQIRIIHLPKRRSQLLYASWEIFIPRKASWIASALNWFNRRLRRRSERGLQCLKRWVTGLTSRGVRISSCACQDLPWPFCGACWAARAKASRHRKVLRCPAGSRENSKSWDRWVGELGALKVGKFGGYTCPDIFYFLVISKFGNFESRTSSSVPPSLRWPWATPFARILQFSDRFFFSSSFLGRDKRAQVGARLRGVQGSSLFETQMVLHAQIASSSVTCTQWKKLNDFLYDIVPSEVLTLDLHEMIRISP